MIQFIYGASGSGKSTLVYQQISEAAKNGTEIILLVPEQQVLSCETELAAMNGIGVPINVQVLSFRRLANTVAREEGGLKYNYVTKGERTVILWRCLCSIAPALKKYGALTLRDRGFLSEIIAAIEEFKAYRVTPEMMEKAAAHLTDAQKDFRDKLSDLSLIYAAYNTALGTSFSDPADDLEVLADTLLRTDYLSGRQVYIDSFHGFTAIEMEIVRLIFARANACTLTLCYDRTENIMYDSLKDTDQRLRRAARESGKEILPDILLEHRPRFHNEELRYLSRNLWNFSAAPFEHAPEHIRLVCAHDVYEEAEFVARDIHRKIRGGKRCRDFAVIARSTEEYTGIIDAMFEKYSLPCFLSKREDITLSPAVRLVLCALSIHLSGWRTDDVLSYLKTGVAPLTADECNLVENYAVTWGITGRRWYDEYEWNMNPAGYSETLTEQDAQMLIRLNSLRDRIKAPLLTFFEVFQEGATVKEVTARLYRFLEQIGLSRALQEQTLNREESIQVWNCLMDAMDQLVHCAADAQVTADVYRDLLLAILSEASIGKIPACTDEITIGDASLLRLHNVTDVYLIGALEGVFPRAATESTIFSDAEKRTLESLGIRLSEQTKAKNSAELFFFCRAVSSPSETLTVTYPSATLSGKGLTPSIGVARIRKLFPALAPILREKSPLDLIESYEASFEYAALYHDTPLGKALIDIYARDQSYQSRIRSLEIPVSDTECALSGELAGQIYKQDLRLSQSRLDTFAKCEFSYHCKYILRLQSQKTPDFKSVDIGNFIHLLLERFMNRACSSGELNTEISKEEIEQIVDSLIDEYIRSVFRDRRNANARLLTLISRLKRTAMLLIDNLLDEFRHSEFRPAFFELPISDSVQEGLSPYTISLPGGGNVRLYGIIDRVDIYHKGNDTYIRIVDYKTGSKTLSASMIEKGQEMQMLLYLFAIWKTKDQAFLNKIGARKGSVIPAGAQYYIAKAPTTKYDNPQEETVVLADAQNKITRSGITIKDEEIMHAMDKTGTGKYLTKDLCTLEQFGEMLTRIEETVGELGTRIKSGSARAQWCGEENKQCAYCDMKPVCRKER